MALANAKGCQSHITVVFRYDDYDQTSNARVESSLLDLLVECHTSFVIGVTPYVGRARAPLAGQKAERLREALAAGTVEVALHGYSHEKAGGGFPPSEFTGLPLAVQKEKLAQGKGYLEELLDTAITCFIPPWNSYDSNTLLALDQLGFCVLSARTRKPHAKGRPPQDTKLRFLPATCRPDELAEAIELARTVRDPDPIIVVMTHPFDFREHDERKGSLTLREFRHLLAWSRVQDDVRVLSLKEVCTENKDLSFRRLSAHLHWHPPRHLPTFLRLEKPHYVYWSTHGARQRRVAIWTRAAVSKMKRSFRKLGRADGS